MPRAYRQHDESRGRSELRASLASTFPRRISAIDTIVAFISIDLRRSLEGRATRESAPMPPSAPPAPVG
jgi:hypothetical protein